MLKLSFVLVKNSLQCYILRLLHSCLFPPNVKDNKNLKSTETYLSKTNNKIPQPDQNLRKQMDTNALLKKKEQKRRKKKGIKLSLTKSYFQGAG